jgi:hypothetical protein
MCGPLLFVQTPGRAEACTGMLSFYLAIRAATDRHIPPGLVELAEQ